MKIENEKKILREMNDDLKKLMDVKTYKLGAFTFNVDNRTLSIGSENVKLTRKESYLFVAFASNVNIFLERKFLLELIWKDVTYSNSRSMDVYICKLRKLLAKDTSINIVNFHAMGYKLIIS